MTEEVEKHDLSKLRIDRTVPEDESDNLKWLKSMPGSALAAGCLILLAVCLYLVFGGPSSKDGPIIGNPSQANSTNQVDSRAAYTAPSASTLNATGYVVAQRRAAVSSKATGRLKELRVVEGDVVKQGDVLGVLENEDLAATVRQYTAIVDSLNTRVKWAQAELDDANTNLTRVQSLRAKDASSQADLEKARARQQKALADIDSATAQLHLGKAQLEKANVDLSYTTIVAPFDGTVLSKDADVGEVVAPFGSSAQARGALVTIADMSSLQVEADVSEANISKVFVGQEAEITLDAFPDHKYKGVVTKIVPTVDRAKATVMTKIKFVEIDSKVLPEMSAKVVLSLRQ